MFSESHWKAEQLRGQCLVFRSPLRTWPFFVPDDGAPGRARLNVSRPEQKELDIGQGMRDELGKPPQQNKNTLMMHARHAGQRSKHRPFPVQTSMAPRAAWTLRMQSKRQQLLGTNVVTGAPQSEKTNAKRPSRHGLRLRDASRRAMHVGSAAARRILREGQRRPNAVV